MYTPVYTTVRSAVLDVLRRLNPFARVRPLVNADLPERTDEVTDELQLKPDDEHIDVEVVAGDVIHEPDIALLQPLPAPMPKCLDPVPGSYDWMNSHTWVIAGAGLRCRECDRRWP
jgi:hypothetical protein